MRLEYCWHCIAFNQLYLAKGKIAPVFMRQNKIHDFSWADQDWIRLMIFKNFAEQDWIGFNFIGSGQDLD